MTVGCGVRVKPLKQLCFAQLRYRTHQKENGELVHVEYFYIWLYRLEAYVRFLIMLLLYKVDNLHLAPYFVIHVLEIRFLTFNQESPEI